MTKLYNMPIYLDAEIIIDLVCSLADYTMQQKLGGNYTKYIKKEEDTSSYTEKGQDIFNEIYDETEHILALSSIYHADQKKED